MTGSTPASDALAAVTLLGEVSGTGGITCPAGPCAYCRQLVQMIDGQLYAVDGELHTCPEWVERQFGRRYVHGEFRLAPPTR